jgi:hemerythrin
MLLNNHASGQTRATVEHARALRDWLMWHVQERDVPLASHLQASDERPMKASTG